MKLLLQSMTEALESQVKSKVTIKVLSATLASIFFYKINGFPNKLHLNMAIIVCLTVAFI